VLAPVNDAQDEMGSVIEGVILSKQTENLPFHWSFKKEKSDEREKSGRFSLTGPLEEDPAARFLEGWYAGEIPVGVKERVEIASGALVADHNSLGLAAVLWRYVLEPTLDGPPPRKRTVVERKLLAKGMQLIGSAAIRWRKTIVEKQLDPYLLRGRTSIRHRFELSKAYRPPPPWVSLARDTQVERWGKSVTGSAEPITAEFIKRHPYAEEMRLSLLLPKAREGKLLRPDGETSAIGGFDVGIFDILQSPPGESCAMRVSWSLDPKTGYDVTLRPGTDHTYIDLLRLVHNAHEKDLKKAARRTVSRAPGPMETNPLFLLVYRNAPEEESDKAGRPTLASAAQWYLADFFLF
jgi:hypothetical protein